MGLESGGGKWVCYVATHEGGLVILHFAGEGHKTYLPLIIYQPTPLVNSPAAIGHYSGMKIYNRPGPFIEKVGMK